MPRNRTERYERAPKVRLFLATNHPGGLRKELRNRSRVQALSESSKEEIRQILINTYELTVLENNDADNS